MSGKGSPLFGGRKSGLGVFLLVILLATISFLAINIWAGMALRSTRIDLTEDRIYSLSDGTRQTLADIREPITLRLYQSARLVELGPFVAGHVKRVNELLDTYTLLSGGRLAVERYDPVPFSPEEDLAVADQIQGIPVGDGTQIYFGLAGFNSTDDREAIGYLAPERANFLEYDLTRMIHDLANPEKPEVALLGDLPLRGTQNNNFTPFAVIKALESVANLRSLGPDPGQIPEDVDIVLMAEAASMRPATVYGIDQFIMRGGRVLAFVDPLSETRMRQQQPGTAAVATTSVAAMDLLLQSWGVVVGHETIAADRASAVRVQTRVQNRDVVTDYVVWMGLPKERLESDDVVTGQLQQINIRTAGVISAEENAATSVAPLIRTSPESMVIDAKMLQGQPDPIKLLQGFTPSGEPLVLAARITGPLQTAFPDGPPAEAAAAGALPAHVGQTDGPAAIILVADSDILDDSSWVQRRNLLGQSYEVAFANNGDFLVNAVENLAGSAGLASLRGKGLHPRRFEVLDDMARRAEDRFRDKEQQLLARINEIQTQIKGLQEQEAAEGALLTSEQQLAVDEFRNDLLELRAELREVQFALNRDVENLEFRIKALNIWAMPLALTLVAVVLAFVRRRRAEQFRQLGEG